MAYVADVQLGPDGKPLLEVAPPKAAGPATEALTDTSELADEHVSLCEVLDRVLNKGVVVKGELVITVANIELLYLGLELLLCSVDKARQAGVRLPRDQTVPPMLHSIAAGPIKALR